MSSTIRTRTIQSIRPASLALLAGIAASVLASGRADASIIAWSNPAGGSADIGANWTGGVVPGAADTAQFLTAGPYIVTFPATFPATTSLSAGAGTVTWSLLSPHSTGTINIGNDTVSVCNVSVMGNTLNATGSASSIQIGRFAGTGSGTLTASGSSAIVRATAATGDIVVGATGHGTLNVSNGARVESSDDIFIGLNAGSVGIVGVSGNGLPAAATLATASATTGDIVVGSSGTGTLTAQTFGVISVAHDLLIATQPGSTGTVNLINPSGNPGFLTVGHNVEIGRNATGGSASGTGLLLAGNFSTATVSGATTVGDPDGGTGTLRIDGGTYTTHDLAIDPSFGALDFRNGILIVSGGVFTPDTGNFTLEGAVAGAVPTLRLTNGASFSAPATLNVVNTSNRAGRLEVLSDSQVSAANINLCGGGAATGGNALALVSGIGSSLSCTNTLTVASRSTATLDILSGGHVQNGFGNLGETAGSQGVANVSGAGSTWTMSNSLSVGGTSTLAGGTGSLSVTNAAVVSAAADLIVYPGSTLTISSATVNITGNATLNGTTTITNGTLTAGELLESNSTNITASGRFDAHISNPSSFNARIALNGALDIGPSLAGNSFGWAGFLDIGPHALSIRHLNGAGFQQSRLGTVTINGGSITPISPNRGTTLANGDSLVGTGTINGPIELSASSTVTPTGVNGLTFNGPVTVFFATSALTINGTQINFGPAGGFTGHGALNARIVAQPGSVITADGNLNLGAVDPFGFTLSGATLNTGPFTVTLVDTNGSSVGLAHLDGGVIVHSGGSSPDNNLNTSVNGHLTGHGRVQSARFYNVNGGAISPGSNADAAGVGTITLTGLYAQTLSGSTPGTLNVDLSGSLPGQFDALRIGGNATLGGTLNVSLINGYVPQPGVLHPIITTDTGFVLGDFAVKNLPPDFVVVYGPNAYSIGLRCVADVDDGEGGGRPDNGVGIEDLLFYLALYDAGDIRADVDDGSGTGFHDGGVGIEDLLYYLERFDAGC